MNEELGQLKFAYSKTQEIMLVFFSIDARMNIKTILKLYELLFNH